MLTRVASVINQLILYYGLIVAGSYAFAIRILSVPIGFVQRALRQVLLQRAAETQHHGRSLEPLYIRMTVGLFSMAIVPTLVLVIWAPWFFSVIFGERWLVAGEFARGLVLWLSFAFCNLPAVLFARLIRVQRMVFMYELALLAARTMTLVIGGIYLAAGTTILAFSIVGGSMNCVLILLVGHTIRKREAAIAPS